MTITKKLVATWLNQVLATNGVQPVEADIELSKIAAAYGAKQREAELMAVGMGPVAYLYTEEVSSGAYSEPVLEKRVSLNRYYATYKDAKKLYTAEQIAAARLQGAGEERKKWEWLHEQQEDNERLMKAMSERIKELEQASAVNQGLLEALESIALAGMSGTGQESEEGMRDWHARRAWEFIGIAARAISAHRAAIAAAEAHTGEKT